MSIVRPIYPLTSGQSQSYCKPMAILPMGSGYSGTSPHSFGEPPMAYCGMDYFTKWEEAELLTHITDADSKKFVWKNVITRFGIPRVLMSDNGTQFDKTFYEQYGIRNHFSTPAYAQGNGQAESSNKTLLDRIKKRLGI